MDGVDRQGPVDYRLIDLGRLAQSYSAEYNVTYIKCREYPSNAICTGSPSKQNQDKQYPRKSDQKINSIPR